MNPESGLNLAAGLNPEYCDLHIHGAFGVDVVTASKDDLNRLSKGLAERGYASFLPTLVPLGLDELETTSARLGSWIRERREGDGRGAVPLGIHFEGPLVSADRAGALHPSTFMDGRDDARVQRLLRIIEESPGRSMITLAPEIPGGIELIGEIASRGTLVSLGHTDATIDQMESAVTAGARHVTHFCNAMRPLHHREPGPVGFGLRCREVSLDLIADLHHVHPKMMELVIDAREGAGVVLISDAMPAAGMTDGDYSIWGETLTVSNGTARNASGSLAGSIALLDGCVQNASELMTRTPFDANAAAGSVPKEILTAGTQLSP